MSNSSPEAQIFGATELVDVYRRAHELSVAIPALRSLANDIEESVLTDLDGYRSPQEIPEVLYPDLVERSLEANFVKVDLSEREKKLKELQLSTTKLTVGRLIVVKAVKEEFRPIRSHPSHGLFPEIDSISGEISSVNLFLNSLRVNAERRAFRRARRQSWDVLVWNHQKQRPLVEIEFEA